MMPIMIAGLARVRTHLLSARAWLWLPVAIAGVDLAVLVVQAKALVLQLYLNADTASAPVIGSYIGNAPHGRVVTLGQYPWYEPLWFMQATDWLPAHREIWQLAPFVFSAAAVALVVWTSKRAYGPWVAAMTAALLIFASPDTRRVLFTLNTHGASIVHGAILGAGLVYLSQRTAHLGRRMVLLLGVALAAVTACGITDSLVLATGLLPFLGAGCLGWLRTARVEERRVAVFAISVTVGAIVGAWMIVTLMRHMHIVPEPLYHLGFVPAGKLLDHVELLVTSFAALGGGPFFGAPLADGALFDFAAGSLYLAGAAIVARWIWGVAPKVLQPASDTGEVARSREAYVTFWCLTFLATIAAFVLSSGSVEASDDRYLASSWVAIAALLPVLCRTSARARGVLVIGLSAFGLLTVRNHVFHSPAGPAPAAMTDVESSSLTRVSRYVQARGLTHGYAAYQVAAPLTWRSRGRLQVFPVQRCFRRTSLCRMPLHAVSTWYRPRPHTPTFLVALRTRGGRPKPWRPSDADVHSGKPIAMRALGHVAVYVFDHDIAVDVHRR